MEDASKDFLATGILIERPKTWLNESARRQDAIPQVLDLIPVIVGTRQFIK